MKEFYCKSVVKNLPPEEKEKENVYCGVRFECPGVFWYETLIISNSFI